MRLQPAFLVANEYQERFDLLAGGDTLLQSIHNQATKNNTIQLN